MKMMMTDSVAANNLRLHRREDDFSLFNCGGFSTRKPSKTKRISFVNSDAKGTRSYKRWCEKGDWVLLSKYSGHRFECDNVEMRLVNDDSILAVVSDPTKISRATA